LFSLASELKCFDDSDDSNDSDNESIDEMDDPFEPTDSVFSQLFADEEKMKTWEHFVNLPEEEQEKILGLYQRHAKPEDDLTPSESWRRIHKPTRQLLRKCKNLNFLESFDKEISTYLAEVFGQKTFTFEQQFYLHLAAGVCDYYQLVTKSTINESGQEYIAIVNRCNRTTIPGGCRFIEFIRG